MTFRVQFTPESDSDLDHLDSTASNRVLAKIKWLSLHFESTKRNALTGDMRGLFRLRIGDYRVVYSLDEKAQVITIHSIGHRKDVYKSK